MLRSNDWDGWRIYKRLAAKRSFGSEVSVEKHNKRKLACAEFAEEIVRVANVI